MNTIDRFLSKVNKTESCWLWNGYLNPNGYGRMVIGGRKGGMKYAHRISWTIYKGVIPDNLLICHKCDVRNCVNPDHLFIGTYSDNNIDRVNKGRTIRADKRKDSKLTYEKASEIRKIRPKYTLDSIARKFNVSRNCIYQVLKNITWKEN